MAALLNKVSLSSGYGNHKVIIDDVALIDENNNNSEIFMSGHPFKIAVRLTGQETMDNLTLGILIRDKFGQDIYGTNSCYLKKQISIKQKETIIITYAFEEFNITGSTHIDECFHWMDKSAVFEVVSGDGHIFVGLARLTPDLHVGK
jgi:lipopolysaccharide transport system ATP-binding protein